ncbi:MAG: nucleotidyltransferase domain-containing protein [Sedimentisphaerales bacterium]|nr:nucleotidyltransferase domain-containing protein [Sedimentisphaerales bacterium]
MGFSIETYNEDLKDLCQRFHVRRLDIFGSAAMGQTTESSDVDLLVEFDEQVNPRRFDNYFEFLRSLEKLFGRHVDLVESGGLRNPYFIKEVDATKRPIYATS